MATFFEDVSKFDAVNTSKDAGLVIVGVLGANIVADKTAFIGGASTGAHALRAAGTGVLAYAAGSSFLGPREGRDLAIGAFALAGFEGLSALSHGKVGANPLQVGAGNPAASQGVGNPPLITAGVTVPTTQGLGNNAAGVSAGTTNGTGM